MSYSDDIIMSDGFVPDEEDEFDPAEFDPAEYEAEFGPDREIDGGGEEPAGR
jgi:hypothetical protein